MTKQRHMKRWNITVLSGSDVVWLSCHLPGWKNCATVVSFVLLSLFWISMQFIEILFIFYIDWNAHFIPADLGRISTFSEFQKARCSVLIIAQQENAYYCHLPGVLYVQLWSIPFNQYTQHHASKFKFLPCLN